MLAAWMRGWVDGDGDGDGGGSGRTGGGYFIYLFTSAVLGTLSQKTSIFMSPRVVWSVTDMVAVLSRVPLRRVEGVQRLAYGDDWTMVGELVVMSVCSGVLCH